MDTVKRHEQAAIPSSARCCLLLAFLLSRSRSVSRASFAAAILSIGWCTVNLLLLSHRSNHSVTVSRQILLILALLLRVFHVETTLLLAIYVWLATVIERHEAIFFGPSGCEVSFLSPT